MFALNRARVADRDKAVSRRKPPGAGRLPVTCLALWCGGAACLALLCCGGACLAGGFAADQSGWKTYENAPQGYSLRLPPELAVAFTRENEREWSAENRMPFDYVNFRPQPDAGLEPFELGLGVHWNKFKLATRIFADSKDEGLLAGGAQIRMIRQSEIEIAGIKGVRDDFLLRQPYGWRYYSRAIIPRGDRFFVFLCTLGKDEPVADFERVFRRIVASFVLADQP